MFRKNIQFSKLIKAGGRLKEFNFRKPRPDSDLYEVDVSDDRGNRLYFNVRFAEDRWNLQESLLPSWITEAETLIQEAILEQEKVQE